jgi:ABC-type antimicrobial peptide transport system permease subunit
VRQVGFESDLNEEVYFPYAQSDPWGGFARRVLVRTEGDPLALARAVTEDVYAIDPDQPVSFVQTLTDAESARVASPRTITALLGIFSLVALVTAAAGILSVIAFSTSQRRREIGIRLALGSERRDVLMLVLRGGLGLTVVGLVIGGVLAVSLGGVMEGLLFGVEASDPVTLGLVALGLLAAAGIATWVPAWRGTRIDPIEAVRAE